MGKIFVLMGPSGVGKTTLIKEMIKRFHEECCLVRIPTYTTRMARIGEIEGVDYFFVTPESFQNMQQTGELLEWSSSYNAFYGTGRSVVDKALVAGKNILLAIDRQGAIALKRLFQARAYVILIASPSDAILKERLNKRGAQSNEVVSFRLNQAHQELEDEKKHPCADETIINDDFETALLQLKESIKRVSCC